MAVAFCAAALVGVAIVWSLGRSGSLFQPERIAVRIGLGLFAIVVRLLLAVILIPGAHVD